MYICEVHHTTTKCHPLSSPYVSSLYCDQAQPPSIYVIVSHPVHQQCLGALKTHRSFSASSRSLRSFAVGGLPSPSASSNSPSEVDSFPGLPASASDSASSASRSSCPQAQIRTTPGAPTVETALDAQPPGRPSSCLHGSWSRSGCPSSSAC